MATYRDHFGWESSTRRLVVLAAGWTLAVMGVVVIAAGLLTGNSTVAMVGVLVASAAALLAMWVPEPRATSPNAEPGGQGRPDRPTRRLAA